MWTQVQYLACAYSSSPTSHRRDVRMFIPRATLARRCFVDNDGPMFATEASITAFNEGGSWRFCEAAGAMLKVVPCDTLPPACDLVVFIDEDLADPE